MASIKADNVLSTYTAAQIKVLEGLEPEYGSYLEHSAMDFIGTFHKSHGEDPDYALKIIFSVESYPGPIDSVVQAMRNRFDTIMDLTIVADKRKQLSYFT